MRSLDRVVAPAHPSGGLTDFTSTFLALENVLAPSVSTVEAVEENPQDDSITEDLSIDDRGTEVPSLFVPITPPQTNRSHELFTFSLNNVEYNYTRGMKLSDVGQGNKCREIKYDAAWGSTADDRLAKRKEKGKLLPDGSTKYSWGSVDLPFVSWFENSYKVLTGIEPDNVQFLWDYRFS